MIGKRMATALALLGLAACEGEIVRPGAEAPAPGMNGVPFANGVAGVHARATGAGHFVAANGELRKFTFSAVAHDGGGVSGQFQLVAGDADLVAHGTVTCMAVVDNQAWIGGTVDRNSIGAPITHGWWRAVENAGTATPDQISLLVVANNPAGDLNQAFCDNTPEGFPPLIDVAHGSITVE